MSESKREVIIVNVKRLVEFEWFSDIYRRIYDILAVDGRLPPPDEIYVITTTEGEPPDSVLGFALSEAKYLWFRELPPQDTVFAHELIHLAKKRSEVHEEVYAYNLSTIVAILAERGIMPRKNPLTLFEDVTYDALLNAINGAYGYRFDSVTEFFEFQGIMLFPTHDDERLLIVHAISEIIAGALYDPRMFDVLLRLLS